MRFVQSGGSPMIQAAILNFGSANVGTLRTKRQTHCADKPDPGGFALSLLL
jgi:hypothetical protein